MCCAHEVATFKARQSMIGTCLGKPPVVQCRTFSVWAAGNLRMTCDKSLWATLMTTWSVTKNLHRAVASRVHNLMNALYSCT